MLAVLSGRRSKLIAAAGLASFLAVGCSRQLQDDAAATASSTTISSTTFVSQLPAWTFQQSDAPLADFELMFDLAHDEAFHDAMICGYLYVIEPYVYLVDSTNPRAAHIEPHSFPDPSEFDYTVDGFTYNVIGLPRAGTHYDPQTRSLWTWDEGPFTDGDYVSGGGAGSGGFFRPFLASSLYHDEAPC